jgi:hypothetical protein
MRRIITILLFAAIAGSASLWGQQMPHYTQYMFNDFVINPAIAGVHPYYQIRTNHRFQWVGMTDPPLTSVEQFGYKMGQHAAQMLLKRLFTKEDYPPVKEVIKSELIVRGSTVSQAGFESSDL